MKNKTLTGYILPAFTFFISLFIGVVLTGTPITLLVVSIILYTSALILFASILINVIVYRRHKNQIESDNMVSWVKEQRQKSEDNIINYDTSKKKLKKYHILGMLYVLLINYTNMIVLIVVIPYMALEGPFLLVSIFLLFFSGFSLFNGTFNQVSQDFVDGQYLQKNNFPVLYELLEEIKQELSFKPNIQIVLTPGANARVSYINGHHYLTFGVISLMMLNKEELQTIMMHEIGHLLNKDTVAKTRRIMFYDKYQSIATKGFGTQVYYMGINIFLQIQAPLHEMIISKTIEVRADNVVKQHNGNEAFINASLKMVYFNFFNQNFAVKAYLNDAESPSLTIVEDIMKEFKATVDMKKERFNQYIKNELTSKRNSHPILRERMDDFNIHSYKLTPFETYNEEEMTHFLEAYQAVNATYKEQYKEERKHTYLKLLKTISEYDPTAENDISKSILYVEALFLTQRLNEALETAVHFTEIYPTLPFPHYLKGLLKLYIHNDPSGIDDIIQSVKIKPSHIHILDIAAHYNSLFGDKEKQDELREIFFDTASSVKLMNETKVRTIKRSTKLTKCKLPESIEKIVVDFAQKHNFNKVFSVDRNMKDGKKATIIYIMPQEYNWTFEQSMNKLEFILQAQEEQYYLSLANTPLIYKLVAKTGTPIYSFDENKHE